ncbi:MAG: dUTP diphosphatase [Clostridiales bacterium]|nr:dUTP diphosphatase [Clostridiales bacterium]
MKKEVAIKKLQDNARIPTYGTEYAAGADLYACMEDCVTIQPGETTLIHTGIAMEIPEGYAGLIYARSGLASKKGLAPANKVGVVDADYRGEIMVALHNHSNMPQTLESGERIAQMVITPFLTASYVEVPELSETVRGEGGFGSTGTK